MEADKELLESLLEYIGKRLRHKVEGMLIGGNAMMFYGVKGQTKDLDIVLFNKEDVAGIVQIIKSHPLFRKSKVTKKLPYMISPELLKKGEPTIIQDSNIPRFDLFYKYVFSVDVKDIFLKAKRILRFDLLKLKLIEPEDLVFLKGVTGRPVDNEDVVRMIKDVGIDWRLFLEFAKKYHKKDKGVVWLLLGNLYDINKKSELIPEFVVEELAGLFAMKL